MKGFIGVAYCLYITSSLLFFSRIEEWGNTRVREKVASREEARHEAATFARARVFPCSTIPEKNKRLFVVYIAKCDENNLIPIPLVLPSVWPRGTLSISLQKLSVPTHFYDVANFCSRASVVRAITACVHTITPPSEKI